MRDSVAPTPVTLTDVDARVQGLKVYCDENISNNNFCSDLNLDTCRKIVIIKCYYQFTLSVKHVIAENSRKTEKYLRLIHVLLVSVGVCSCRISSLKQIMVVTKVDNMASYSTYTGKPKIFFPKKVRVF